MLHNTSLVSVPWLFHHTFRRPASLFALHPEHSIGSFGNQSERLLRHGRVLLAVALDLGIAAAALFLGDGVHDHGDVSAAAPPGGLF